MLHCDSVASRGVAQRRGCWEMPPHRGESAVVTTSHGREEVGNETRSDRVKHCRHRDEGADERQNMETDEPDGNEFGVAGVECLVQQPMEKTRDVDA